MTMKRIHRHHLLTLCGLGGMAVLGLYGAVSCLIDLEDPRVGCGIMWQGVVQYAMGEQDGEPVEIQDTEGWVVGRQCMLEPGHGILTTGGTAGCHLESEEEGCEERTGCRWFDAFPVEGRYTPVCLYDDGDYQTAFRHLVERLIEQCVTVAEEQDINPHPCEEHHGNQQACAERDHCTWNNPWCEFDHDNCTNAAVKAHPYTNGNSCFTLAMYCENPLAPEEEAEGGSGEPGLPDPSEVITQLSSNAWEIDAEFFDFIMNNQTLLLEDDARIEPWPWGGFYFTNVEAGSFADELGFQSGDILIQINEYYLTTFEQTLTAYENVYDLDSWEVKIQRSTNYVYLYYDLD
jgi:hypothetical protein